MKATFLIFELILVAFSCIAQFYQPGIIPVEKSWEYIYGDKNNQGVPDGTYFKDVNNFLGKYTGIWQGNAGDKTIKIDGTKIVDHRSREIKEDKLLLRYKITDQNGNEYINTLNLPKDATMTAEGDVLLKAGEPLEQYHFIYF